MGKGRQLIRGVPVSRRPPWRMGSRRGPETPRTGLRIATNGVTNPALLQGSHWSLAEFAPGSVNYLTPWSALRRGQRAASARGCPQAGCRRVQEAAVCGAPSSKGSGRGAGGIPTARLVRPHARQPPPTSSACTSSWAPVAPVLRAGPCTPWPGRLLVCWLVAPMLLLAICHLSWMPFSHFSIWLTSTHVSNFSLTSSRKPFLTNPFPSPTQMPLCNIFRRAVSLPRPWDLWHILPM